jgi:hypothetical protein
MFRFELPIDLVQGAWNRCVRNRGAYGFTPLYALQPHAPYQAFNRTTCHVVMLTIELMPDFISTVNLHIGLPNTLYFRHQDVIYRLCPA